MTSIEEMNGLEKELRSAAKLIRQSLKLKPGTEHWTDCEQAKACDAAVDAIVRLQRELEEARMDVERLNWLDEVNRKTNERNGTVYGWKFDINHNRAALMDHNWPAVSVRSAIDAARQQSS